MGGELAAAASGAAGDGPWPSWAHAAAGAPLVVDALTVGPPPPHWPLCTAPPIQHREPSPSLPPALAGWEDVFHERSTVERRRSSPPVITGGDGMYDWHGAATSVAATVAAAVGDEEALSIPRPRASARFSVDRRGRHSGVVSNSILVE